MGDFLLYGSYGYTGRLIAERAVERGLAPLLAGRNHGELERQGRALRLEFVAVELDDPAGLAAACRRVPVVVHAAGPFARTARPMVDACLATGTHYVDITGEIPVFEAIAARDGEARAAGVMMLPGAGFDVVPTDCLAAHLQRRLPSATRLTLAFASNVRPSRGTALTALQNLHRGGAVRRGGRLVSVPAAWKTRQVDFGRGPTSVTSIPWGDVATAHHSTGIPDIEAYMKLGRGARGLLVASRYLRWLLGSKPIRLLLERVVRARESGPSAEERERGSATIWGQVEDGEGRRATSRLRTPEGYTLTAITAVAAVEMIRAGRAPAGFQTPSLAFGADWVLEMEGVTREDVG